MQRYGDGGGENLLPYQDSPTRVASMALEP